MDIRRLNSFISIVDCGSITRAADILHLAQPALSQQLVALEEYFGQKLLIRSQRGVSMTDAGHAVYRHAQIILKQMEQARVDARAAGISIAGRVSVGLIPFSSASTLSIDLLSETRKKHPAVLVHLTESVGQTYSQMIMNGRLDLALIHASGPIKGVHLEPLLTEEFYFVAHRDLAIGVTSEPVPLQILDGVPMLMPPEYNLVRRTVDIAFNRSRTTLRVVAEVEVVRTLARAVARGLGATIMPKAIADRITSETSEPLISRALSPRIEQNLSLCTSEQSSLSEPARAVKEILLGLAGSISR